MSILSISKSFQITKKYIIIKSLNMSDYRDKKINFLNNIGLASLYLLINSFEILF